VVLNAAQTHGKFTALQVIVTKPHAKGTKRAKLDAQRKQGDIPRERVAAHLRRLRRASLQMRAVNLRVTGRSPEVANECYGDVTPPLMSDSLVVDHHETCSDYPLLRVQQHGYLLLEKNRDHQVRCSIIVEITRSQ